MTGPAIYVYGHNGPEYGSFEVTLDGEKRTISAYAASDAENPLVVYKADNLTYGKHELSLRNLGAKDGELGGGAFVLDSLQQTIQLAPAGFGFILHTGVSEVLTSVFFLLLVRRCRIRRSKKMILQLLITVLGTQIRLPISVVEERDIPTRMGLPSRFPSKVLDSFMFIRMKSHLSVFPF